MNPYLKAIEKNEVIKFLRGIDEYYIHDRDWDQHDITSTYQNIMVYLMKNPDGLSRVKLDIIDLLNQSDLQVSDIVVVLGIIWNYLIWHLEEKKLNQKWVIEGEIRNLINKKLIELERKRVDTSRAINVCKRIHERFKVDICECK